MLNYPSLSNVETAEINRVIVDIVASNDILNMISMRTEPRNSICMPNSKSYVPVAAIQLP